MWSTRETQTNMASIRPAWEMLHLQLALKLTTIAKQQLDSLRNDRTPVNVLVAELTVMVRSDCARRSRQKRSRIRAAIVALRCSGLMNIHEEV